MKWDDPPKPEDPKILITQNFRLKKAPWKAHGKHLSSHRNDTRNEHFGSYANHMNEIRCETIAYLIYLNDLECMLKCYVQSLSIT